MWTFLWVAIWSKLKLIQYNYFHCTIPLFLFACHSLHYEHTNVKYVFFTKQKQASQLAMPNIFCQIYIYNGTKKVKRTNLKKTYAFTHQNKTSHYLVHWYNKANTEMHARQADLFNLVSHNCPSKCLLE